MATTTVRRKKEKINRDINNIDEVMFTMREFNLLERIVRVEEEIKKVNSNIQILIHQMDKRIEELREDMDKRINELRQDMDKRFEMMQRNMDKRFEMMQKNMDKRFEDMNKRFNTLTWLITGWMTMLSGLIVLFKFMR